jgi:hypothetical protein
MLGFIAEELLHSMLIVIFSKNFVLKLKITTFYIIPILFSFLIPNIIHKYKTIVIIIIPPAIVVLSGIFLLILTQISIYNILAFCFISFFSLLPINLFGIKTDMFSCKELLMRKDNV